MVGLSMMIILIYVKKKKLNIYKLNLYIFCIKIFFLIIISYYGIKSKCK